MASLAMLFLPTAIVLAHPNSQPTTYHTTTRVQPVLRSDPEFSPPAAV